MEGTVRAIEYDAGIRGHGIGARDARPAEAAIRSPLTGSARVTRIGTLPTAPLVDEWRQTYGIEITGELRGLPEICVYRCDATGLVFFRPESMAGSPALYGLLQAATPYYATLKWEHRTALRDLGDARTVVEIGCGAGLFVGAARAAGFDAEGLEVNPDAVAAAQRAGLPVRLADDDRAGARCADAVCAFQVLEHVPDPGEFLRKALRLLRPGGALIVSVPNAEGFLRYYREILDLPPHHMSQWRRSTFEALPRYFPLRLTMCRAEPLAAQHVNVCVGAYAQRLRSSGRPGAMLANRYVAAAVRRVLRAGLRRAVTGHTLYARFVKSG